MKQYKFLMILLAGAFTGLMTSCENQDVEFPDFDYSSVYFAYQYPGRTIVLGEDIVDNTLDNEHKCKIFATMGGAYANDKKIDIDIAIDNSLVNNLFFSEGIPVQAMPSEYYQLAADQIFLENSFQGGVEVQLTDAFFADPNSIKNTYVIPLRMTNVANADSILSGVSKVASPASCNATDWDILPKDYVLYCVKFINPWHANYLRRGEDVITMDGVVETKLRYNEFVEKDQEVTLSTISLNAVQFPMDYVSKFGHNLNFKLDLNFDENASVTVTPFETSYQVNDSVRVYNVSASGTGEFVKDGEKKSWGNQDRDALYLDYDVSYQVETKYPNAGLPDDIQVVSYSTVDTLVVRNRGVTMETFSPLYSIN